MKKKYVKPELFYENFEMSQQIAACDYDSNNTLNDDENNCKFTGISDFGSMTIFLSNCSQNDTVDVTDYGYCYHNATSSPIGTFNS